MTPIPRKQQREWSDEERELLKLFFPSLPLKDLMDLFNRKRGWLEICSEAEKLGITRIVDDRQPQKRPNSTLAREKLRKLLNSGNTVEDIAKKLKSTPEIVRRNIHRYSL